MVPRDYQPALRKALANGKSLDDALAEIRALGASILESIIAVKKFRQCDLGEAKKLVHLSPTWADARERNDKFHRELVEAAYESSTEPFSNVSKGKSPDGRLYPCPCCGCRTLSERAGYELCPVCFWEDDGQDDHDADNVRGGPNSDLSLTKARENYRQMGACASEYLGSVRRPLPAEL